MYVVVVKMSVICYTMTVTTVLLFDLGVDCSPDTDDISCSVHRVCIRKANTGLPCVNIEIVLFNNLRQF